VTPMAVPAAMAGPTSTAGLNPLLQVESVVKHFPVRRGVLGRRRADGLVRAVDGVSLNVYSGQTLGLVGETGSGKSTLARCIARLHNLTAGRVVFDGVDISRLSRRQLRPVRRELQMIFQDPFSSLNPHRRVGSIIGDPFAIHGVAAGAERRRRVRELMELVGLNPEHYNRFPAEFSGGQRQRIGIARALALRPRLLVCDEPVSALDVSIQAQIINLLADLQRDLRLTYVVIAHDLSVVRHVSDQVAVMYLGKVVEQAPVAELYGRPRHPYSAALLSAEAVPDPDLADRREHILLAGDPPSPVDPPRGCPFHPRCPRARDRCTVEQPLLVPRLGDNADHPTACHFPIGQP
jgi:oligopeptide/dipeptide ABC transporter ATP-binding protein